MPDAAYKAFIAHFRALPCLSSYAKQIPINAAFKAAR